MRDDNKTKKQLIGELAEVRQWLAELEQTDAERKQAQKARRAKGEYYRRLIESAPEGFVVLDSDGIVRYYSQSVKRLLGYEEGESTGKSAFEFVHPDDMAWALKKFAGVLGIPGVADVVQLRARHKDGSYRYVEVTGANHLEDSAVRGVVLNFHEVTERRMAEEAVRRSEERYRLLADNVTDVIWTMDMNLRITYISPSVTAQRGYTVEEAMAQDVDEMMTPDSVGSVTEALAEGLAMDEQGHPQDVRRLEAELYCKDGSTIWTEIDGRWVRDSEGKIVGSMGVTRDITERKRMEDELRESEEKLRIMFDAVEDAITVTDISGKIVDLNRAALSQFRNRSREEAIGQDGFKFIAESSRAKAMEDMSRVLEGESAGLVEYTFVNEDGKEFEAESSNALLHDGLGNPVGFVSINRDITERKQMEEQLRKSLLEKELLLKELHHRVKNNLQIISSLLSLQSKYIRDKRALRMFEETQNRVMSMALFHDKIYRSGDLASIDFAAYVKSIVAELFHSYGVDSSCIRTKMDMKDIRLGVDAAIPCGLIINELVSNSVKHAFPDKEHGEISIVISDKEDNYTLIVGDDGVGFPQDIDFMNTESLGLQLVVALVHQLEGTIELDRSEGTVFKITFGVPKAAEEG